MAIFVERDPQGRILALHRDGLNGKYQELDEDSDELSFFLGRKPAAQEDGKIRVELHSSDLAMVRVLEDLIDVLIQKSIIHFTDLPETAQAKLNTRTKMRKRLNVLENPTNEDIIDLNF